ncbi:MAG: histidine phosphatase family protein [Cyclobacteriaceae bacterium]
MVKTLLLIRHANAEQGERDSKDFDRHLTRLGNRNAAHAGKYLVKNKLMPDLLLCSKAIRAKETAEVVASQLKFTERHIRYHDDLYEASVRTLFAIVNDIEEKYERVAMIAHNPGLTYLADYLTSAPLGNMVPGSIVVVKFENMTWAEVSQNSGRLEDYIDPETSEIPE